MKTIFIAFILFVGQFDIAMSMDIDSGRTPKQKPAPMNMIATSPFVVYSFLPNSTIGYFELDYGRTLDKKNNLIFAVDIFKYFSPMSMPWSETNKYPGYIVSSGIVVAYQRFIWNKFFVIPMINPNLINYFDKNNSYLQSGFQLLFCARFGYHFDFEIFKLPLFLELGLEVNSWPINANVPQGFRTLDDKYNIYAPSPALNFGYKF